MKEETRDKLLIEIARILIPIATEIKNGYDERGKEIIEKIIVNLIKIRREAENETE